MDFTIDRSAKTPLAEQMRQRIAAAIDNGVLEPGTRLPSWQDLAAHLGVAHGTVRTAYERLAASQLIVASCATGTLVAQRPRAKVKREPGPNPESFLERYMKITQGPSFFQLGVPATEALPKKLITRIRANAIRAEVSAAPIYPDPRGELELRREIAGYLAISSSIDCSPSQIIITCGYSGGLGLTLRGPGVEGETTWIEEPGFPFARKGLELARVSLAPIPVDAEGIDIDYGLKHAPNAKLVVVTPGQQHRWDPLCRSNAA